MRKQLKVFSTYTITQFINYSLLVLNFRMIAQHNVMGALISEAVYTTVLFFLIKKIAHDDTTVAAWAGFVAGSVMGTWMGMSL